LIYHSQKEYNATSRADRRNIGNHVQLIYLPSLDTKHIVQDLYSKGIQHIMVEGGPVTALKFLKEGMRNGRPSYFHSLGLLYDSSILSHRGYRMNS
jgi:riboflavin biosynthesis pyrimidine reductase